MLGWRTAKNIDMGSNFSESDLQKMNLQSDGKGGYEVKKKALGKNISQILDEQKTKTYPAYSGFDAKRFTEKSESQFRAIKLTLFGEPMPKQSVLQGIRNGKKQFYQPQKKVDKTEDYILQIKTQLPPDFKMFETCVFVRKMHFMYAPLKSFHKVKGKMDAIRNGKKFYKNTRPDLPDNLKKLVNDAMSGLVYKDDNIIVGEDDVKKYYGIGGCVIIELEGY